jgi:hypothetical protein
MIEALDLILLDNPFVFQVARCRMIQKWSFSCVLVKGEKINTLPMKINAGTLVHSIYLFKDVFVYMSHLNVVIIKKTQTQRPR